MAIVGENDVGREKFVTETAGIARFDRGGFNYRLPPFMAPMLLIRQMVVVDKMVPSTGSGHELCLANRVLVLKNNRFHFPFSSFLHHLVIYHQ